MSIHATCLLAAALSVATPSGFAQCPWSPLPPVATPGGPALEFLGYPVALSGDDAAVGAPADAATPGGSVYLLRRNGSVWSVAEKVAPNTPVAGTGFGAALALEGDRLVVGAPYENAQGFHTGAVYVFARTGGTWTQAAHLAASNAFRRDYFGSAVALDGSTALIGAYGATELGVHYNGAAYLFEERSGAWTETQRLLPAPGGERGLFGRAVALRGSVAVVGAPFEDPSAQDCGAAYVFTRSGGTWSLATKLLALAPELGAEFGAAVAVTQTRVFVGAPRYDGGQHRLGLGAVEVFRDLGGTWSFETELRPADSVVGDYFGFALAARGDTLLVGAHGNPASGLESGAAYEFGFANGAWHERQKLVAADAASGARFGLSVALDMDVALVGAPLASGSGGAGAGTGVAYAFDVPEASVSYGAGCPGSTGKTPTLGVLGCATAGGQVVLRVEDGTPGARVLVLVGKQRAAITLPSGCMQFVAPILLTLMLPPIGADGTSIGQLSIPAAAQPGRPYTLQAFVGGASAGANLATSNGIEIVVQ
ncbi:MAG: FG-GAP repeat protein [Planctomycetes bacterium]|nr:FG-GAP repeat protein [Planctomycetota bacterium]